ncbi:MAG: NAD(P)/FAD-dependent oxidoreductase [Paludibacter sp.]|nr:NAD(P)/FAD-dependent oxidoreductase [Paludibacter sp.]
MPKQIQVNIPPESAYNEELTKNFIAAYLKINKNDISGIRILKRSIDARKQETKINVSAIIYFGKQKPMPLITNEFKYQNVENQLPVIIIGAGPAGIFAALRLIELGLKPIIIEQGKDVHQRKKDIAQINRNEALNPLSNYCFGQGGAGAFSDGKLHTRSTKKGNISRILEIFHLNGANENVLYDAHPHIGSDKLPDIIENLMNTILKYGGEVHYNTKLTDILIKNNKIAGCQTADGKEFKAKALILATGHSARDIYELLQKKNLALQAAGFAMGVRVEHSQTLIDTIQYHSLIKTNFLPPASYTLTTQIDERGVYSFCMCPGGHIVPAVSAENQIVVNGMSVAKRNSPFANSGIVVEIRPEDVPEQFQKYGAFAGLRFQQYLENLAFTNNGGKGQTAPAQRVTDFVTGKLSASLPKSSYLPGLISSPLHFWLPKSISIRLQKGFMIFDRRMRGFLTNDAVVVGVESRTSSPVRILRDKETMQHIEVQGLFPCGEGAGYAGGITSSAMDGENAAAKVAEFLGKV